ncbi:hypothetical protein IMSHALPRED_007403 [Imshaugia aleurites]|uniref:Uncharacterized protein n=1 Tax=Imshaugia aleurites TaxID=172621 RepID=A0A8H3IQX1_9LECA|nr:hypothetical protein IMSHALPRED_007403 [Imshaugia aleurites]
MALRDMIIDEESSTEIAAIKPISDELCQAALIASEQDSDGDNPFEPQPKRFMQTVHQKRQHEWNLEVRKMAWTIKKFRKTHKAAWRQRLKDQKQDPSPFQKLPPELVLKLMQHTHLRNVRKLIRSSAITKAISRANQKALWRGIEIEQFPDWKWLFGDSKHRTPAQLQHLKDARVGAYGWAYDGQLLDILQMIDKGDFTGVQNVKFLQDMQDRLDVDVQATESYTGMRIARRTAMCLRSLSFERPLVRTEEGRTWVEVTWLPWEVRCQRINEQPASIQAEIRSILHFVVKDHYLALEDTMVRWASRHYHSPGNHREPQEVKEWMSKLATAVILETVITQWRAERIYPQSTPEFAWETSFSYSTVIDYLTDVLDEHDNRNIEALLQVEYGVEFGTSIGLEPEGLLVGTMAWVDTVAKIANHEA